MLLNYFRSLPHFLSLSEPADAQTKQGDALHPAASEYNAVKHQNCKEMCRD